MTKLKLSELLHQTGAAVGEGEQFLIDGDTFPKIAYFEISWDDVMASGDGYEEQVTYQISVASKRPRDPALVNLKRQLNDAGLHPQINHEYVNGDKGPSYYHSYFSVTVEERVT